LRAGPGFLVEDEPVCLVAAHVLVVKKIVATVQFRQSNRLERLLCASEMQEKEASGQGRRFRRFSVSLAQAQTLGSDQKLRSGRERWLKVLGPSSRISRLW